MNSAKLFFFIKVGFLFIGVIFVCIALGMFQFRANKKQVCTQPVQAVVVDMIYESERFVTDSYRSVTWYPVYKYYVGGNYIQVRSRIGGMKDAFEIGQKVTLMVNPENFQEFYNENDQTDLIWKIFLVIGFVLIVFAISIWIFGSIVFSNDYLKNRNNT